MRVKWIEAGRPSVKRRRGRETLAERMKSMTIHYPKIQALSKSEFEQIAVAIMRRVFESDNPFDEPFSDAISDKVLLCEFMYELEYPLLEAVVRAASEFGDEGFFVSLLIDIGASEPHHWYVPFEDIGAYPSVISPWVENIIFSPNGTWGLIASPEDFAIIGGTHEFMKTLRELAPDIDEQVGEFLIRRQLEARKGWRVDWVPSVLKHVFGEEQASSYLHVYGLD